MTLKTRWFGKKVKGDALVSLVKELGENPDKLLQSPGDKWSTREVHGRASFTPAKEGVKVDLYIFRTDYHIRDGTIPADNFSAHKLYSEEVLLFSEASEKELTQTYNHHIQGEIKYQNVSKI